jgi:flagellar motor switch protein FliN
MDELEVTPEELAQVTASSGRSSRGPESTTATATARPASFAPLKPAPPQPSTQPNLGLLMGVTLKVAVELGRTKMEIKEILQLGPGSVIELDKLAGEPVDVLVNDRVIARGEVVVIDDRFGVRITDVLLPIERVSSFKEG